jgi:hypothetical protein
LGFRKVLFSIGDLVRLEYLESWRVPHSFQWYIPLEEMGDLTRLETLATRLGQPRLQNRLASMYSTASSIISVILQSTLNLTHPTIELLQSIGRTEASRNKELTLPHPRIRIEFLQAHEVGKMSTKAGFM